MSLPRFGTPSTRRPIFAARELSHPAYSVYRDCCDSSTGVGYNQRPMNEVSIKLMIESLPEGGYVATSPDVPGLVAEGRSVTEAVEIAQGLTRKIVESCLEHGDPVPPALQPLGKQPRSFELKVPVSMA